MQTGAMIAQHGAGPATASHQALGFLYQSLQQQATLLGYIDIFHVMGWLFLLTAPLVLLMRKPTLDRQTATAIH